MDKKIRQALEKPFDKKFIKQRPGSFGRSLNYVEADVVITRLNNIFDDDWSFNIQTKPHEAFINGHIVVQGTLSVPNLIEVDGKLIKDGDIHKTAFGGKKANMAKIDGSFLDLASDYKASSQDCLKKCASYIGIALDLYGTDIKEEDDKDEKEDKPEQSKVKEIAASSIQLKAIQSLATSKKVTALLSFASKTVGKDIFKLEELTESEAKNIIVALNSHVSK